MVHYEIEFPLGALEPEIVEAALAEVGAVAVTLQDRGDQPVLEPKPGEVRLWADTLVRALFSEEAAAGQPVEACLRARAAQSIERLARRLGAELAAAARVRLVEERIWERVWLEDWRPLRFGRRLWVCPTTSAAPQAPDAVVVHLDPGLAFGTGTHPTTALCLERLDALPLAGRTVLDYGCGSGILAIAALKLGARRAVCVDLDEQALLAARQNAQHNGVAAALDTRGVTAALSPADCTLANILAGPLIELAPVLTGACSPGADLVLSGLLLPQVAEVAAAYRANFAIVGVTDRDDWCCIHARKVR